MRDTFFNGREEKIGNYTFMVKEYDKHTVYIRCWIEKGFKKISTTWVK